MTDRPPPLREFPDYEGQVEETRRIPPRPADSVDPSAVLDPELAQRLSFDLWSHQARCLERLEAGDNVCVSTSTASGKTYIYALEIARQHLRDSTSTALLIYPTRALSADQESELDSFYDRLGLDIEVGVYDGDATAEEKRAIREGADVVITNFAGLNQYLPHHEKWDRIHRNLRTVVVEESHTYSGVPGMHAAWILRRLRRLLESDAYRSDPRFILTSATIGNPGPHARRLVGDECAVVDEDGSPREERAVVLWNPPEYEESTGLRKSTHRESSAVLAHLLASEVRTLMFAPSRKMTELDTRWTRQILEDRYGRSDVPMEPYHAGHRVEERRSVEDRLKNGELAGVVSTTALELGINIGNLDATVLSGYPGSRQQFWQQVGRSGRDRGGALNVMVAHASTLDQYIMNHPDYLFEESVEDAVLDLDNNGVFLQHVLVAAREQPLRHYDTAYFGERLETAVDLYRRQNKISGSLETGAYYTGSDRPESRISLYGSGGEDYEVRLHGEGKKPRTLGDRVGDHRAHRDFHPGAIYLHRGEQYEVTAWEETARGTVIDLKRTDVDYYTDATRKPRVDTVTARNSREVGEFTVHSGSGEVDVHYPYFKRKDLDSQTVIETLQTGLDEPVTLHTDLLWLEIPEDRKESIRGRFDPTGQAGRDPDRDPFLGGIHAVEHGLVQMAPTELLIEARDLGGLSVGDHPETGGPTVFLYDAVQGGMGFTRAMYDSLASLVHRTRLMIESCSCDGHQGCPACVMDYRCGNNNVPLHTHAAVSLLRELGDVLPGLGEENGSPTPS